MLQTILVTLGGSVLVLSALFAFLGRVWINRIYSLDVEKSNKRFTEYQASINRTISELSARNEPKIHVHKVQVEAEYKRYENIWEQIQLLLPLFSTIESRIHSSELLKITADEIRIQHGNLGDLVNSCYPFIDNSVYQRAIVCVGSAGTINVLLWEKDDLLNTSDQLRTNLNEIKQNCHTFNSHANTLSKAIKDRIDIMTCLEK